MSIRTAIDHFGILAPFYDRAIPIRNIDKYIKIVDLPVDGTILDAGGGTGRVASALVGLASHIIVADLSHQMLRQVKEKNSLQPVETQSEQLPFPDDTFERVIMVDAFHHVYSQAQTAQELWRVLKPGGRIVIEEPDIRSFSVKLVALFEKLALMRSHMIAPVKISTLFNFPGANTQIERNRFNAWIVVGKGE